MIYINKNPIWADIRVLWVVWHSEMVKKDPNPNERPSQLRMALEFCLCL